MLTNLSSSIIISAGKIGSIIIMAFAGNYLLQRIIAKEIYRKIQGSHKERIKTLVTVFSGTVRFLISILALLLILPEFGINIAALLAGISVFGLAISLAAQNIVTDFLSGVFIILEDQYIIGDKVKVAGIEGVVKEMSLRRTIIEDEQGTVHYIPNGQIKGVAKIRN